MRAVVAMSGGVDSAAAALLLREAGFETEGATLLLHPGSSAAGAAALCAQLGLPHHTLDLRPQFAAGITGPFCREYRLGRTPNPCILCNRALKFGALLDWAAERGADIFATGHYARVEQGEDGLFRLKKALHPEKDQSYVLYHLSQAQLARVRFPLGQMAKEAVRAVAARHGLAVSGQAESQDICFVPDGDYAGFIEAETGEPAAPGDFVLADGTVVGRHRGLIHYTVGQRKGLGLAWAHPLYVLAKDAGRNRVVVGPLEASLTRTADVGDAHWILGAPQGPVRARVRTRYHQREADATVTPLADSGARITFDAPVRAPAPGQAAVFYSGDWVLGGGIIL